MRTYRRKVLPGEWRLYCDHIWLCKLNVLCTQKSPDFCSVCELSQEGDKYELSAPNGARMALPYQEETRLGLVTISYFPHYPKTWILISHNPNLPL